MLQHRTSFAYEWCRIDLLPPPSGRSDAQLRSNPQRMAERIERRTSFARERGKTMIMTRYYIREDEVWISWHACERNRIHGISGNAR